MATKKRVGLVTGVGGQDGAYLSKFLLEKGYRVFGLLHKERKRSLENLEYLGVDKEVEIVF